jgi:type IV secretion system protein VirB5
MSTQTATPTSHLTSQQRVVADEIANEVYAAHYSERRIAKIAIGSLAALSLALSGAVVYAPAVLR